MKRTQEENPGRNKRAKIQHECSICTEVVDSFYNCRQVTPSGKLCGGECCADCIKNYHSATLTVDKVKEIPEEKAYIHCPSCQNIVPLKGSLLSKDDVSDITRVIWNIKSKDEVAKKDDLISTLQNEVQMLRKTHEDMKCKLVAQGDFKDGMKVKEIVDMYHEMMTPRCPNCKAGYVYYGCNAIMCNCGAYFCGLCEEAKFTEDEKNNRGKVVKTKSGLCHEHVAKCPWNKDFKNDYFSPEAYPILLRAERACNKINDIIPELCVTDLMDVVTALQNALKPTKCNGRVKFDKDEKYTVGAVMKSHVAEGTEKDAVIVTRTITIERVYQDSGEYDISWYKDDVYVQFDDDGLLKVRIPREVQDAINRYKGKVGRDEDIGDVPIALREGDVAPQRHAAQAVEEGGQRRQRAPRRCGHCVRRGLLDQAIGHDVRRCPVLRAEREEEQAGLDAQNAIEV